MSATPPSSCSLCHRPLTVRAGDFCAHCGAPVSDAGGDTSSGLELDWEAAPELAARRLAATPKPEAEPAPGSEPEPAPFPALVMGEVVPLSEEDMALDWTEPPTAEVAPVAVPRSVPAGVRRQPEARTVEERAPGAREWRLLGLGVLALVGVGGVLLVQEALPERFPPLLEMGVLRPLLTGAPSDFFPPSAWALALLPWGLFALALGVAERLARRAGVPLDGLEWVALALLPGLNLVGAPYAMKALGTAAESRKQGLRLRPGTWAAVAVLLQAVAVALALGGSRSPGEALSGVAWVARLLSVAALGVVLAQVGRALGVLVRFVGTPEGGSNAPSPLWAGMLAATAVALVGVGYFRSSARACEPGTSPRQTRNAAGTWVSECVLPNGTKQGAEWKRGPEGRLLASGAYLAGQRHGTFRTWSERGVLLEELPYAGGLPHGKWTLFLPGGQRLLEETYVEGQLDGTSTAYHANGTPRLLKGYQKGVAHGRYATWFDSGLVEEEGTFEQGQASGVWVKRDRSGKVLEERNRGGTAGMSALMTAGASANALRAGHTTQWWKERLEQLRNRAMREPELVALYELTLRRARSSGFVVQEKPEGLVLALEPTR